MLFRRRKPAGFKEKLRELVWPRKGFLRPPKYLIMRVLRLTASPHAVAVGVAAGVFVSWTPFIGVHFVMSAIRVLVLEDSLIIAMEAEDILRLAGVENIDIVGSVEQARAAITAETYDFALLDVNLGEGMQDRQHFAEIFHQHALGDFEFKPRRRQRGGGKCLADISRQVAAAELDCRNVDGDLDALRPLRCIVAGPTQNPTADIDDEADLLCQRNEIHRRNAASDRMVPADQRFEAADTSLREVIERLIMQLEFLFLNGCSEVCLQRVSQLHLRFHLTGEEALAFAPVRLGMIWPCRLCVVGG